MRPLLIILAIAAFAAHSFINDDPQAGNPDNYCAKMQDGIMKVMHEGTVITADVTLGDGTVVKVDGTVVKKDGTSVSLKDGECVGKDGNANTKEPPKEK